MIHKNFYPNPHHVTLHTDFQLVPPGVTISEWFSEGKDHPLHCALTASRGVTSVRIQRYEVGITKGNAFKWDDILPAILNVIEACEVKA